MLAEKKNFMFNKIKRFVIEDMMLWNKTVRDTLSIVLDFIAITTVIAIKHRDR